MFDSVRAKLTLWYICILTLIIFAFGAIAYSVFITGLHRETDDNLLEIGKSLAASVTMELARGEHHEPEERMVEALVDYRYRDYHVSFFSASGELVSSTIDGPFSQDLSAIVPDNGFGDVTIGGETFRAFLQPFESKGRHFKLYVFTSRDDSLQLERRVQAIFLLVTPLLLLVAGLGGYFLARQGLRPLTEMCERVQRISAANLHERLPVGNRRDEIGGLAVQFNHLLDRLDREFERQKRFMADASHELRTPIAIVQGESEVTLSKEFRSPSEYRESLGVVHGVSRRMSKIVEDLFTLARADSGELKPHLHEMYLDELVGDSVRAIRALANKRNITIDLVSSEARIRGDEPMLRRLFINLLDNAVKYNITGGTIKVTVADHSVTISNTGPTIPEGDRSSIFDRFYRVDKARARRMETTTGGAGLGLAISKWIADVHNARLRYYQNSAGENTFEIIFPR